jgi:hypothetical protein
VASGAPLFGRQTDVPAWKDYPLREGRVILGETEVTETDVKLPAENARDAKAK